MIVISELSELFPYHTGTLVDWAVPCYLLVGSPGGPSEIYIWFRLNRSPSELESFIQADVFMVYERHVLQVLGGGFKSLTRSPTGEWRERTSNFKYSEDIESLFNKILEGRAFPISKLLLMTHPVEELREAVNLALEAKFVETKRKT